MVATFSGLLLESSLEHPKVKCEQNWSVVFEYDRNIETSSYLDK
jgi:hypothetical protein